MTETVHLPDSFVRAHSAILPLYALQVAQLYGADPRHVVALWNRPDNAPYALLAAVAWMEDRYGKATR